MCAAFVIVVRVLLSSSPCAVDWGAVYAVDVIFCVFLIGFYGLALLLVLSSCAMECGDEVGVIVVVFVGVIRVYVRALCSVISTASSNGIGTRVGFCRFVSSAASSSSSSPLTCLNDSRSNGTATSVWLLVVWETRLMSCCRQG